MLPLTTALRANDAMESPSGSVILTVSGTIDTTNVDDTAQFDLDMLRSFPATSFSTSTIWTDGVHMFTGVPLASLLDTLGSTGNTLRASAINDYAIEISIDSLEDAAPVLVYEMNGEPMHRRDKGPLWIVYPYDSEERFRTAKIYSHSVWQLDRIEILD
ncbi:molybdopterin-dependent oxidoreductase [Shimia sp. NS0008-38b]|uniref:molybdopterin-dependent oxidoreductase n=1 Tax=Shimia sp. NS0008-38b TaxID=3127653 RepID=UPI00333F1274